MYIVYIIIGMAFITWGIVDWFNNHQIQKNTISEIHTVIDIKGDLIATRNYPPIPDGYELVEKEKK